MLPLGDGRDGFLVVQPIQQVPEGRARILRAGSQLATQLTEVLSTADVWSRDPALVRIVSNAGHAVPYERLTAAVSGAGRRGFIRDSRGIAENVTLVPPGAMTTATRHMGPKLLSLGVSVAVDVIAQEQQTRLLDRIAKTTEALHEHAKHELEARLRACIESMDDAAAVLLDGERPGAATGFDSALHDSRKLFHHALQDLQALLAVQQDVSSHPTVPGGRLSELFPGADESGGEIWRRISFIRRALALRSRALNLQVALQPESEPEMVSHLGELLTSRLADVVTLQEHFDELLGWFGALEVDVDEFVMIPTFWSGRTALAIQRNVMALTRDVDADAAHARQVEGVRIGGSSAELIVIRDPSGDLHVPL